MILSVFHVGKIFFINDHINVVSARHFTDLALSIGCIGYDNTDSPKKLLTSWNMVTRLQQIQRKHKQSGGQTHCNQTARLAKRK